MRMDKLLIIENVDLDQLEVQRKCLTKVINNEDVLLVISTKEHNALLGIEAMLDHWSDEREASS